MGADGAHSQTRLSAFGQSPIETNLFNIVQIVYKTNDKAKELPALKKYALLKKVDLFVEDTQIDNQVNLRFFVSDEAFEAVKHFSAKRPCVNLEQIADQELQKKILFWMKSRQHYIGDELVLRDSLKMTAFRLDCYRSSEYGKILLQGFQGSKSSVCAPNNIVIREVPFVLCGDACFGVPFYRSLRNGWMTASNLVGLFVKHEADPQNFLDEYCEFVGKLYESETSRARSKYHQVSFVKTFCHISSLVPWQIVFIPGYKEKLINDLSINYV